MDIEQAVKQWLDAAPALAGWPVLRVAPATRPDRFITVERTGGGMGRYSSTPVVALQAWAPSRAEAAGMADIVAMRMLDMPRLPDIADTSVESVTNLPFPGPPVHNRYQILVQITRAVR